MNEGSTPSIPAIIPGDLRLSGSREAFAKLSKDKLERLNVELRSSRQRRRAAERKLNELGIRVVRSELPPSARLDGSGDLG